MLGIQTFGMRRWEGCELERDTNLYLNSGPQQKWNGLQMIKNSRVILYWPNYRDPTQLDSP
jgi:hypothetical protein